MRWPVLLILVSLLIQAQVLPGASVARASDSNYYVFFYPKADSREPNIPSGKDRRDWKYFYRDIDRYVSCMQQKNAERDIKRIKKKTQAACATMKII